MARVVKNIVTQGLSGMLGDQIVFSQRRKGQTFVSVAPQSPSGPASAAQVAHRKRFQQTTFYARNAAQDPATKALYAEKAKEDEVSVFNVVVADFMKAPDIQSVDLTDYTGRIGDPIRIVVEDDFAVERVQVRIENGDGTLVEEGDAAPQANSSEWVYVARANNASLVGDKLTVTVNDHPGNTTQETQTL